MRRLPLAGLDERDAEYADSIARQRDEYDRQLGLKPVYGAAEEGLALDVLGARGELAFATWAGIEWPADTVYEKGRPDFTVGRHVIEVRTRSYRDYLLLHRASKKSAGDHPTRIYVLLATDHRMRVFEVVGWILGAHGMLEEYWGDPYRTKRPAYWVPRANLYAPDSLLEKIEEVQRDPDQAPTTNVPAYAVARPEGEYRLPEDPSSAGMESGGSVARRLLATLPDRGAARGLRGRVGDPLADAGDPYAVTLPAPITDGELSRAARVSDAEGDRVIRPDARRDEARGSDQADGDRDRGGDGRTGVGGRVENQNGDEADAVMWISFDWTTPALMAGRKTVTRRLWKPAHAARFKAGDLVTAYNKSPRDGGRPVATIRLTEDVVREWAINAPPTDYEAEGFDYLFENPELVSGRMPGEVRERCSPEGFEIWRQTNDLYYVVRFELVSILLAV